MDVSVLILNYNTCQLTLDCIASVYRSQTQYTYEMIVVDNHSSDDSVTRIPATFPDAVFIANPDNGGFAKGNNIGMKQARGRYTLLLNSDTIVEPDTLETMVSFMDSHPHAGAAGCKIILPDGTLDKACKRGFPTPSASFYYAFGFAKWFPNNPKFNGYQLGYLSPDDSYQVDSLVGAFMLVRREVIEQIGGLDEAFFMYGEDIDWCYRIKKAGWEIHYRGNTFIVHYKGASSRRKPFKIIYEFHRAMWLFHRKHYRKQYSFVTNGIVYAGIGVKLAMSLIKNKLLRPASTSTAETERRIQT